MTEMTDLEWLARNEPEWDEDYTHAFVTTLTHDKRKTVCWANPAVSGGKILQAGVPVNLISKDQWQAERQRLGLDACPHHSGLALTPHNPEEWSTAPEWDGEGLPPVGCECEVRTNDGDWVFCRIVGYHGACVVFFCDDWTPDSEYDAFPVSEFRPFKSQEQREREETIDAACKVYIDRGIEGLYDAGMLKKPD